MKKKLFCDAILQFKIQWLTVAICCPFFVVQAMANVRLPAIFGNNMVLQQKSSVAVWGWAAQGEEVTVTGSWDGANAVKTMADEDGKWKLFLTTPKAGGPYSLYVSGNDTLELKDVLIGEVWICSGQSNMGFPLKSSFKAKEEIANADLPQIRYFNVSRQFGKEEYEDSKNAVWVPSSPQTAPAFSAVAYYFAKKLQQDLNLPIGIIYAAWGGTPAEAWIPTAIIQNDPALALYNTRWQNILQNVGEDSVKYHLDLKSWKRDSVGRKKPEEPQTLYYYNRPWREPAVLFNGMISPLIPFGIKGFLWYQGESNVGYASEYGRLFEALIESWRNRWQEGAQLKSLPFYFVQLAPFAYASLEAAARLRQAQQDVAKTVPNTAMALTMDVGNMKDIHFTHKKEVGDRLAAIALKQLYGKRKMQTAAPGLSCITQNAGGIELSFDQSFPLKNNPDPGGFELGYSAEGLDSIIYRRANCSLNGRKILLRNEAVSRPVAVRYGWLEIGKANIMGSNGLPLGPFSEKILK